MQNIEFGVVTQKTIINVEEGYPLKAFAPVDENGEIANNGDAYGIVIDALGIGEVKQLVVMTAGCIDKICAEQHYGESYSAEAISALENIVIYDNHKIGGGGGGGMMIAHIIYNEGDETYSCDKTFEDVLSALPLVTLVDDVGGIGYVCYPHEDEVMFSQLDVSISGSDIIELFRRDYILKSDNTVEYVESTKTFE